MRQSRLAVLLIVLAALLTLRWWKPPADPERAVVVPATRSADSLRSLPSRVQVAEAQADWSRGTRNAEEAIPRNAFAVRLPPAPPASDTRTPVVPRAASAPRLFVGPPVPTPQPAPPPPPPPPLQVIGGWLDEKGPSVFVAGPRGVTQGRVGDVLAGEYRIARITPQQVLVTHVPTNREIGLVVPPGNALSLAGAK